MKLNEFTEQNSLVQEVQELPSFQRWFRKSRAKNHNGSPKVLYHFTDAKDNFKLFHPFSHFGTMNSANHRYIDIQAAQDQDSSHRIVPVFLSVQNPLDIPDVVDHDLLGYLSLFSNMSEFRKDIQRIFNDYDRVSDVYYRHEPKGFLEISRLVQAKGYDSFRYINKYEDKGSISYVILKPAQAIPVGKFLQELINKTKE